MTMRAWGVIALVVSTTVALLAGMLTLSPYGVAESSPRDQSGLSPRRGAQVPIMIAAATIDLVPSSRTPMLIEIGPPEWVPHDSTLQVQGLPPSVTLSQGRRVSSELWAVPVAALSKVRIDVAADALAGWSDVTLSLVGPDGSYITGAHTAITINALTVANANEAATDISSVVSRPQGLTATSPPATTEVSAGDLATSEREASGTSATSTDADRATPGTPRDQRASGPTAGAVPAKGPDLVMQREAVGTAPEPAKPSSTAANGGTGLAEANDGPTKAAKGDTHEHAIVGEEIASQRTIRGAAAAPAAREVASATKGLEREAVVAEAPKPSAAASEAPEVAGAKGGSATPAKGTAQGAHPGDGEENAVQREGRVAPAAPPDQEPAPSLKGPTRVVSRETVVASPEPAKPSIAASVASGPAGAKGGPATQVATAAELSPEGPDVVAQRETVVVSRELEKASASALAQVAHASRCMTAGGWGTGAFEGFASYMAESAMKNSAKARLGDDVKIGAVRKNCGQQGLLIECTASAQACR